jgi:hypothetical protein
LSDLDLPRELYQKHRALQGEVRKEVEGRMLVSSQ